MKSGLDAMPLFLLDDLLINYCHNIYILPFPKKEINMPNLVERGSSSNPKMEYQVFLCIFQKNSAMAT